MAICKLIMLYNSLISPFLTFPGIYLIKADEVTHNFEFDLKEIACFVHWDTWANFEGGCTPRVTFSYCIARFAKFTQWAQGEIIKFTLRPLRFLASFAIHLLLVLQGSQSLSNGRKGKNIKAIGTSCCKREAVV